jgi:hypothetical protein
VYLFTESTIDIAISQMQTVRRMANLIGANSKAQRAIRCRLTVPGFLDLIGSAASASAVVAVAAGPKIVTQAAQSADTANALSADTGLAFLSIDSVLWNVRASNRPS